MFHSKKRCYKNKGISLIALIITIIVIIILAAIVIGTAMSTPENANKAKYMGDLSEIQQAVSIKRTENLLPTVENVETSMDTGFTKVKIKKEGSSTFEDGWIVNLQYVGVKNSTLGNAYEDVAENSEITFGAAAPDVYVYDSNGLIYYAQGQKISGETIYSLGDTNNSDNDNGEEEIAIVEPENISDWSFDTITGTIGAYTGANINTLVIPNYINGFKVNEIRGLNAGRGYNPITYGKIIQNIVVSPGITTIGKYAFNGDTNITSISIPNTITILDESCFSGCTKLSSVTIPDSVKTIGIGAFLNASSLSTVSFGNGIESIDSSAFSNCTALTSVTLPNNITSLGGSAFARCNNLESITLSNKIVDIPDGCFIDDVKLNNVIIPSGVKTIGANTFSGCLSLDSITLSNTVESITESFYNCTGLTSIVIPSSVTFISSSSISGYADAFNGCTNLTQITVNQAEDSIQYAPWGATNATVTWNP